MGGVAGGVEPFGGARHAQQHLIQADEHGDLDHPRHTACGNAVVVFFEQLPFCFAQIRFGIRVGAVTVRILQFF